MRLLLVGAAAAAGSLIYGLLGGGPLASGAAFVVRSIVRNLG
jgi:hypothetical protein